MRFFFCRVYIAYKSPFVCFSIIFDIASSYMVSKIKGVKESWKGQMLKIIKWDKSLIYSGSRTLLSPAYYYVQQNNVSKLVLITCCNTYYRFICRHAVAVSCCVRHSPVLYEVKCWIIWVSFLLIIFFYGI
jgi:hypothetical protein